MGTVAQSLLGGKVTCVPARFCTMAATTTSVGVAQGSAAVAAPTVPVEAIVVVVAGDWYSCACRGMCSC